MDELQDYDRLVKHKHVNYPSLKGGACSSG